MTPESSAGMKGQSGMASFSLSELIRRTRRLLLIALRLQAVMWKPQPFPFAWSHHVPKH